MDPTAVVNHLRSDGLRGLAYDFEALVRFVSDRRRLGRTARSATDQTSISDDDLYPRFCALAASDDDVFARFRRSVIYMRILEHTTRGQGLDYLRELRASPSVLSGIGPMLNAHDVGGPRTYRFPSIGVASPTTLRYGKVAGDLAKLFGPLDGMRVAEIGIGYGGQARALTHLWRLSRYELFDLPAVLALAKRFLAESGADDKPLGFHDGREPDEVAVDLVISNYAFSELRRELQEKYLEAIVLKSARGYLTYNHISPPELKTFTADDFLKLVPGSRKVPEVPLTNPHNVIIVWGD